MTTISRPLRLLFLFVWLLSAVSLSLFLDLPDEAVSYRFVLMEMRVPRTLLALLAGATLALVGATYQTLLRNPLASPDTLGTTAGATTGALLSLALGLEGAWFLTFSTLGAFLGAGVATAIVLAVASRQRRALSEILVAGIAVTLAASAISQSVQALSSERALFAGTQWALGQMPQLGYERLTWALGPAFLCLATLLSRRRAIAALALGETWARSLGVDASRVRLLILFGAAIGTGSIVALVGPIAFVGLVVPHITRRLLKPSPAGLLPSSAWIGATFLVSCDVLARHLLPGRDLPVGVITAALGAPGLFWVISRRANEPS